jgi:di/tricarboxylate transporter
LTADQIILFVLLFFVFVFLIWGRWRYDLVAFFALMVALLAGVIPTDQAFSGFGHSAVVIIALVLIVSRGLSNSGAIELLARFVVSKTRKLAAHIGIMSSLAAVLSALMNNVAALALLMPVDMQAATKAKRSPALSLMPLSFASILGGMITLIGTPPNIIIAEFRNDALGAPYRMFDFAPVGIACAAVGVAFVALIGWRLLPSDREKKDSGRELFDLADYIAELKVAEDSPAIGKKVRELDEDAAKSDVEILGLVRKGRRMPGLARMVEVKAGDLLVVEANPENIELLLGAMGLEFVGTGVNMLKDAHLSLGEFVVPESSRQGRRFREHVKQLTIKPGDVLLLLGSEERLRDATNRVNFLPLQHRGQRVIQRGKAWLAVGLFAAAIIAASIGVVYLPIALGCVVGFYVFLDIVPLREIYDSVEWPVIVLLGCMIPIGAALQSTGGTVLIVDGIVNISAGFSPVVVLTLLMIVTMTLSDVMNNTATAVIAAPIAVEIASRLGVSPDPFLMAVAVAASSAFLTPIGHKNNTLIMGPGGYRFGDYWRMGLPLEILIIVVAVPMILWVWPL